MPFKISDRTQETTNTTGLGTAFALAGPVAGYQSLVAGVGDGNTTSYVVVMGELWEKWYGTVTNDAPLPTVSRDSWAGSSTGSQISWPTGTKTLYVCSLEGSRVVADAAGVISLQGKVLSGGAMSGTSIDGCRIGDSDPKDATVTRLAVRGSAPVVELHDSDGAADARRPYLVANGGLLGIGMLKDDGAYAGAVYHAALSTTGASDHRWYVGNVIRMFLDSGGLQIDTIRERTNGTGVTIDGCLIRDGVAEDAARLGGHVAAAYLRNDVTDAQALVGSLEVAGGVAVGSISEISTGAGVTIDGCLIRDGAAAKAEDAHQLGGAAPASYLRKDLTGTQTLAGALDTVGGSTNKVASTSVAVNHYLGWEDGINRGLRISIVPTNFNGGEAGSRRTIVYFNERGGDPLWGGFIASYGDAGYVNIAGLATSPSDVRVAGQRIVTEASPMAWPGVYSGGADANLTFPVGSVVFVNAHSNPARNATVNIYLYAGHTYLYEATGGSGGARLTGTWKARGAYSNGAGLLAQRVA